MTPTLHGADWSDEAPQFRGHVSEMLQDIQANDPDLLKHIGIEGPLGGFRTPKQQEQIWQDPNIPVKARPGDSLHEQGLAADWHWDSPQAKQKLYDYASKHGLVFPIANDDGHMQLAGNPRLARQSAENPSGMWDIMARVESSNGTDLSGPQTSSGQSQGMYGITTGTWKDFAARAGVDLAQYPTPNSAPPQVQAQVAAVIPLARWDPKTVRAIEDVYGPLDTSRPFGELTGGVPPAVMTAGMTTAGKAAFDARNREIATLKEGMGALLKKMGETDPNDPELRALLRQHREFSQRLEQAYLNQAFHAPQRTEQTIFSQLGSLAMLAAVFGGFGTRGAAVSALNAAGAVMEAQNANNDRDYQDRTDVWKLQLGALQNANKMEGDQIQEILDEKRMSLSERHEALHDMFTALGLQKDLADLEVGNYEAIEKNQDQRIKTARDLEELAKTHEEVVKQRLENADLKAWSGLPGKTEEDRLVRSALIRRAKELNPKASDDQILHDAQRLASDPREYPAAVQKAREEARPKDPPNWEWTDAETGTRKSGAAHVAPDGGLEDIDGNRINAVPGSERRISIAAPELLPPYAGPDTWPGSPRKPPPGIDPGVWSMALDYVNSGHPPAALGRASPQQRAQFWQAYPVAQQALGVDPTKETEHWIEYAAKREARLSIERAFGGGMLGRNLISLNTVADHISLFRQYAAALRNHDTQLINQLQNRLATETGSPEVIDYALAGRITGDEVVRLLTTSGGTITDREDIGQRLAAYSSPEQFEGAANTLTNFVRSRYTPLRQQYARGNSELERVFNETMVTPEARSLFMGPQMPIAGAPGDTVRPSDAGGAAGGNITAPQAPARPSGVPSGSAWSASRKQWRGPDGKLYDEQGNPL